jgi:hypothetical protein
MLLHNDIWEIKYDGNILSSDNNKPEASDGLTIDVLYW